MNKINYALLTALFDDKNTDLYKEIYFPVIKYGIMRIYEEKKEREAYYDVKSLQEEIEKNFGLIIPLPVIKNAICAIERNNNDIQIKTYESGNYFKVQTLLSAMMDENIVSKSEQVKEVLETLEKNFQDFLQSRGLTSEKNLVSLFSEYTEEIMLYLNKKGEGTLVNESYANVMLFLSDIKVSKPELYESVNNALWGAIVAGFLQRESFDFNVKLGKKVEYYLDTRLVLAILGLDGEEVSSYAKEMLELIKKAGANARVHSITLKEIEWILDSVAQNGPQPNTSIEKAFLIKDLKNSDVLFVKNNLKKLLEKEKITVDYMTDQLLKDLEDRYKNNDKVSLLRQTRSGNKNEFRDIHDVYMVDYVAKQRKGIASIEKIPSYFVSLNSDLILFADNHWTGILGHIVTDPSKIVIDLWLHGVQGSSIRKDSLTEIMARCFSLNAMDAQNKISIVNQYYNSKNYDDYDEENVKGLYRMVINRSKDAIREITSLEKNEDNEAEARESIQKLIVLVHAENEKRKEVEDALHRKIDALENAVGKMQEEKKDEINAINKDNLNQQNELKNKVELLLEEKKREKEEKNQWKKKEFERLNKELSKSVSMKTFWFWLAVEIIGLLSLLLAIVFFIIALVGNDEKSIMELATNLFKPNKMWVAGIGIVVAAARNKNLYILKPFIVYDKLKDEQIAYWKKRNPDYEKIKKELEDDGIDVNL